MIEQIIDSDLDFLKNLQREVNRGEKMRRVIVEKILGLMNTKEGKFAIIPINIGNFSPGFVVYSITGPDFIGDSFNSEQVLYFRDYQLPQNFGWDKMVDVYMNKRNRELIELTKLSLISGELQRDRTHYEY